MYKTALYTHVNGDMQWLTHRKQQNHKKVTLFTALFFRFQLAIYLICPLRHQLFLLSGKQALLFLYQRSIHLWPVPIAGPSPLLPFLPDYWKNQSSRTTSILPLCTLITVIGSMTSLPTGSTTVALIHLLQTLTELLQTNGYVHVIAFDFSKSFDMVRHYSQASKLANFPLPYHLYNWIVNNLFRPAAPDQTWRQRLSNTPY